MSQIASLEEYFIDPSVEIIAIRDGGRLNSRKIVTLDNGSEWVFMPDKGNERFCGYLYLKEALEKNGSTQVKAADNKLFWWDGKAIVLSRYSGEGKPGMFDFESILALKEVGFTDTHGMSNLRKVGDEIHAFDTELFSFDPSTHEAILEMEGTRAKIEELLTQKVSGVEQPESKHGERSNSPTNNSSNTP